MTEPVDDQVRPLTEAECYDVLSAASEGHLACFSPERDESYVVPIALAYHHGAVYFASVPGQKLSYLREHPKGICLEVDASDQNENRLTVIVTGDFAEVARMGASVATTAPKRQGLRPIFEDGMSPYPHEGLLLCRLDIKRVSGRQDHWAWRVELPDGVATLNPGA